MYEFIFIFIGFLCLKLKKKCLDFLLFWFGVLGRRDCVKIDYFKFFCESFDYFNIVKKVIYIDISYIKKYFKKINEKKIV